MSAGTPSASPPPERVVVVAHSRFLYWWPVWLVGFALAGLTYASGEQAAFVPPGTAVERGARVDGVDGPRDVLVAPSGRAMPEAGGDGAAVPRLSMTASNNPGIVWVVVLCLVVLATNVELRGVWSVIALLVAAFATVLLAVLGLWDPLLRAVLDLDVHVSGAGYLAVSLFLFALWLFVVLAYDRREYMVFTRGQLRVRLAVGAGETVYDTRGMVVQKRRDALFRHWLLGLGTGDLVVSTAGPNPQALEMSNVLFVTSKLTRIHTMLQEREVVKAR